jgi:GTP-binding protein EngB required for normal cell division
MRADPCGVIEPAAVTSAAALLDPLLPPQRRAALADAVTRAQQGHARVLVLGEAKRGKSTLVNALFEAPLLPTGALPLTSVATVVAVGPKRRAEVRYQDGRSAEITLVEVAELVSEKGNPGNQRGVDRVLVTAPCRWLPPGTEVVDTPGTGSVHAANTDEAQRALATLDVAVLVVAADPPVSAAELELLAEAMATASRAAVVVNKADLLALEALAEVVEFTSRVVGDRLGSTVPVFPLSALAERRRGEGFETFATWLQDELRSHGSTDALASTARALRREASQLRDAVAVEEELLRRRGEHGQATLAALAEILDRAGDRARAAVDHVHGEARRLRRHLDEAHHQAATQALAASAQLLGECAQRSDLSPEQLAELVRSTVVEATRVQAQRWYAETAAELAAGMRQATHRALESLRTELAQARRAAGELLCMQLSEVAELPSPEAMRPPSFEASVHPGWEELVSAAVKRHLPARIRHRQVVRELDGWRVMAVPQPFGRARSALQDSLRESARAAERSIEATRAEYVSALQQGLAAVREERDRSDSAIASALDNLAQRSADLDKILTLLRC